MGMSVTARVGGFEDVWIEGIKDGTSREGVVGCGVRAVGVVEVTEDGRNRDGEVGGIIRDPLVVLCALGEWVCGVKEVGFQETEVGNVDMEQPQHAL